VGILLTVISQLAKNHYTDLISVNTFTWHIHNLIKKLKILIQFFYVHVLKIKHLTGRHKAQISGVEAVVLSSCSPVCLSIYLIANNHYLAVTSWQMINDT